MALLTSWIIPAVMSTAKALLSPYQAFSLSLPCLTCVSGYVSQTIITIGKTFWITI